MSEILATPVYDPNEYLEVWHNGTTMVGIGQSDLLSAVLDTSVTGAPRKSVKQLLGSNVVVPTNFFGQHSTASGIPNWTGKLLKIGDLAMNWRHVNPAGSLSVTFSGLNISWASHGRSVGTMLAFFAPADSTSATAAVLPTGLSLDTPYYVSNVVDANTIQVSTTPGGASITFSGSSANVGMLTFDSNKLAALDAVIDAAATAGKELVYQAHDTPAWASVNGASTNKRPKSYKPFATYLKILYSRVTANGNEYSSVLKHIEGWNEPNTSNSFTGTQYCSGGKLGVNFTANTGSVPLSWTAHGLPICAVVQFEANGGILPAEISEGIPYYVCLSNYSANQFAVSASWTEDGSGPPITFATIGSGSWKIVTCDLTIHQAWVYKAAKAASSSLSVLTPAYTGAPGVHGATGQVLTGYRGAVTRSTRYELGECLYLTATDGKIHFYRVSTAGTTAVSAPTYSGTLTEAIADGTAVLTECSISTSSLASWLGTNGAIAGNFFDRIAIHFYQGPLDCFSFDWHAVDAIMMLRQAYGLTARDVWCTEFGFSSPSAASELWRMYLYAIGAGVAAFIYLDWDTGTGSTSGDTSMRLVDSSLASTYNSIAATLTGATVNFVNVAYRSGMVGASINGVAALY